MKLLLLLTMALLISSCANKKDPGLDQQRPNAKSTAADLLKGKTPAEVLRLKYSHATAICSLMRTTDGGDIYSDGGKPAPEEIRMVEMDMKVWNGSQQHTLVYAEAGVRVTVNLKAESLSIVDFSLKQENFFYVASYSPQLAVSYSTTVEGADGQIQAVSGIVRERVMSNDIVASVTSAGKNYDYIMACGSETTVTKDSKHTKEFEAQLEVVNCDEPTDSQKELAEKYCKS